MRAGRVDSFRCNGSFLVFLDEKAFAPKRDRVSFDYSQIQNLFLRMKMIRENQHSVPIA